MAKRNAGQEIADRYGKRLDRAVRSAFEVYQSDLSPAVRRTFTATAEANALNPIVWSQVHGEFIDEIEAGTVRVSTVNHCQVLEICGLGVLRIKKVDSNGLPRNFPTDNQRGWFRSQTKNMFYEDTPTENRFVLGYSYREAELDFVCIASVSNRGNSLALNWKIELVGEHVEAPAKGLPQQSASPKETHIEYRGARRKSGGEGKGAAG